MDTKTLTKNYSTTLSDSKSHIIIFGSGNICRKVLKINHASKVGYIFDNSANLQGSRFEGIPIVKPFKKRTKYKVIICSTDINNILAQLRTLNWSYKDISIPDFLIYHLNIDRLNKLRETLYFTSGSVAGKQYGGGLYKLTSNGDKIQIKKIHSGSCYGMVKVKNQIYFVDTDNGLFKYNINTRCKFNLCKLPTGSRPHGLSIDPASQEFYINLSYQDAILVLTKKLKERKRIKISDKFGHSKQAMHHINDNYVMNNRLFVSMFSASGNWKYGVFDGCVAEYDISTGEFGGFVANNLKMPHSVKFINDEFHVLNSLEGELISNDMNVIGQFSGFSRGLAYKEGYYYIGQSRNRNYSNTKTNKLTNSIDCSISVLDTKNQVVKNLPISNRIGEIHSVVA